MLRKVMGMQVAWIQELFKKREREREKEEVPALIANSSLEKWKEAFTLAKRHNFWPLSSSQELKVGNLPFGKLRQLFFLILKAMSIVNKGTLQTQKHKIRNISNLITHRAPLLNYIRFSSDFLFYICLFLSILFI